MFAFNVCTRTRVKRYVRYKLEKKNPVEYTYYTARRTVRRQCYTFSLGGTFVSAPSSKWKRVNLINFFLHHNNTLACIYIYYPCACAVDLVFRSSSDLRPTILLDFFYDDRKTGKVIFNSVSYCILPSIV